MKKGCVCYFSSSIRVWGVFYLIPADTDPPIFGQTRPIHFSGTNHRPDMTFLHAKKANSSCVQIIWAGVSIA